MNYFFVFSSSSDEDAKKLQGLMEFWEGLYTSVDEEGREPHRFKFSGDKSGLVVVRSNIKKARWKTEVVVSDIVEQGQASQSAPPRVIIYIPCIEAVAESGKVTLPNEIPAAIKKRLGNAVGTSLGGWRIVYSKASVGLGFNVGNEVDRKKLLLAINRGWSTWKVCQAPKFSSVAPDEVIAPDESREQYTEIKGLVGDRTVENLEEAEGVKFKASSKATPPPDDFVLYDCTARVEDPWRIIRIADGKETVVYDATKKRLNEKGIKALLLKRLT